MRGGGVFYKKIISLVCFYAKTPVAQNQPEYFRARYVKKIVCLGILHHNMPIITITDSTWRRTLKSTEEKVPFAFANILLLHTRYCFHQTTFI